MPLYDYQCRSCNQVTEVRHGFKEEHTGACPACGGELARVFNPAGIVFKGSGFYVTDSRKGSDAKSESKSEPKTESKTESAPAKSESAA